MQIIKDVENNVQLKVEMLKTPVGLEGGSWAARISGEPIDPSKLCESIVEMTPHSHQLFTIPYHPQTACPGSLSLHTTAWKV